MVVSARSHSATVTYFSGVTAFQRHSKVPKSELIEVQGQLCGVRQSSYERPPEDAAGVWLHPPPKAEIGASEVLLSQLGADV